MCAVNVSIAHDDDLVIADLPDIELFPDRGAHRDDEGANFFIRKHFVEAGFLNVQNLSAERQDRLRAPIAPPLCRTACAWTFNDKEFAFRSVFRGAVGEFAGKRKSFKRSFSK